MFKKSNIFEIFYFQKHKNILKTLAFSSAYIVVVIKRKRKPLFQTTFYDKRQRNMLIAFYLCPLTREQRPSIMASVGSMLGIRVPPYNSHLHPNYFDPKCSECPTTHSSPTTNIPLGWVQPYMELKSLNFKIK